MSVVLLHIISGCAVTNNFGPYIGKVIDAESKTPIEGAVVFMRCSTKTANPGGYSSHYADFKEVLTDENGEFHLELRVTTFRVGHLWKLDPYVQVFKPGYGVFPSHRSSKSDILAKGTSSFLPTNTYVTITLPELKTKKERRRNLGHIMLSPIAKIPFEKRENIFELKNFERVYLGLKPIPAPE